MSDMNAHISEWMKETEESPIVMSSRIRLARNLENHVHPLMFPSEQDGFRVINEVQDVLPDLDLMRFGYNGSTKQNETCCKTFN